MPGPARPFLGIVRAAWAFIIAAALRHCAHHQAYPPVSVPKRSRKNRSRVHFSQGCASPAPAPISAGVSRVGGSLQRWRENAGPRVPILRHGACGMGVSYRCSSAPLSPPSGIFAGVRPQEATEKLPPCPFFSRMRQPAPAAAEGLV